MEKKERKIILSIVSLFVFILLSILVVLKKISIDYSISDLVVKMWNPTINGFFIFLGEYSQMIMTGIAIGVSIFLYLSSKGHEQKRRKQALIFVFTLIMGHVLKEIIKSVVQRSRPANQLFQETGYSFPSGHAVFSIILFSMLIYFYKDEIKNNTRKIVFISVGVFLIFLIGFSRIYLNVHWLTDVVGGYALGFFLVNLGILLLENKNVHK